MDKSSPTLMSPEELNEYIRLHRDLEPEDPVYASMVHYALEAEKILGELNSGYHTPGQVNELFSRLCGQPVPERVRISVPFYSDYGKNIHLGRGVFINSACQFQDQGGIWIGEETLIGPKVVIATINHGLEPDQRRRLSTAPVRIGKNVWIGASAVLLPGITIGDNSVIAAGAVVNKDVPANCVAGGVPARVLKQLGTAKDPE